MRMEKAEMEIRRIAIVTHIVTPRKRSEFAQFGLAERGAYHFITRLSEKVRIKKTTVDGRTAYQLDMPLASALEILKRTEYSPEVARRKAREALPEEKRRPYKKRAVEKYEPAPEDYPWWGIIDRPAPIQCKETRK